MTWRWRITAHTLMIISRLFFCMSMRWEYFWEGYFGQRKYSIFNSPISVIEEPILVLEQHKTARVAHYCTPWYQLYIVCIWFDFQCNIILGIICKSRIWPQNSESVQRFARLKLFECNFNCDFNFLQIFYRDNFA